MIRQLKWAVNNLPTISGIHRFGLWILLILLTAIVLLFPVHLEYEYHAIQSTYIFGNNLPLFGVLYLVWITSLLLLLFTKGGERKSHWEGLALAGIFALVFLGFWKIIAPISPSDFILHSTTTEYISSQGSLSSHPNIGYIDFPGLHILTLSIHQITGLDVFHAAAIIPVFDALLFSALLYLLFSKSLKNPYLAVFAVLLLIQGSWVIWFCFYPGSLGLVLLTAFLAWINRKEHAFLATWQDRLIAIILLAAVTMTHLVSSICFFFILLGVYLGQRLSRLGKGITQYEQEGMVGWSTLVLFLVIPLAWEIYSAVATFGNLATAPSKFIADLTEGEFLLYSTSIVQANLGEVIPLWARLTRLFWLFFIFGFGGILWLRNLFRLRTLTLVESKETWEMLGIALLSIPLFIGAGGGELVRIMVYIPFFTVPIILRFFLSFRSQLKRYAFNLLAVAFLILSFPTFLAYNNEVSTNAHYSYEFSAASFVHSVYGSGANLSVFSVGEGNYPIRRFVLDAYYRHAGSAFTALESEDEAWQGIDKVVTAYENPRRQSILIFSERAKTPYQHIMGIDPNHPKWEELEHRLQGGSKIYDNGHVQIYTP